MFFLFNIQNLYEQGVLKNKNHRSLTYFLEKTGLNDWKSEFSHFLILFFFVYNNIIYQRNDLKNLQTKYTLHIRISVSYHN